jgi:hypothetical protein
MTLIFLLIAIIVLLATPQDERSSAAVMLGVAGILVGLVGWVWAGVLFGGWGLWRIVRYIRWDWDWNRRRELKAAVFHRKLTRAELDYINKPGILL